MKRSAIFWMIIIACYFASGQDTVPRHYWFIEAGASLLVPVREYNEVTNWDYPYPFFHSEYTVSPRFNASNFFLNIGYFRNILSKKKHNFGFNVKMGYFHHETKEIRKGFWISEIGSFMGTLTDVRKNEIGIIDIGLLYRYRICKKLYFRDILSGRFFWLFHQIWKSQKTDSRPDHSPGAWLRDHDWKIDPGLLIVCTTGLEIVINKHLSFFSQVETPVVITKISEVSEIIRYGQEPAMHTTYLTSLNNLNLINLQLVLSYKL